MCVINRIVVFTLVFSVFACSSDDDPQPIGTSGTAANSGGSGGVDTINTDNASTISDGSGGTIENEDTEQPTGAGGIGGSGTNQTSGTDGGGLDSQCGNGKIDPGELCEMGLPLSESCESLGYGGGELTCDVNCQYDVIACTDSIGSGGSDSGSYGGEGGAGGSGSPEAGTGAGGTGADTQEIPSDGILPPVNDVWLRGPFAVATMNRAGPSRDATVYYPRELGQNGIKHPFVLWGNGAGVVGPAYYANITQHIASHGFAVYTSNHSSDQGTELAQGLDWMIAENDRQGSEFYQKLDVTKTASMGHSQGSLATFAISSDPRITTTIHLCGGTNPDLAAGHEPLASIHAPTMFICGEDMGDGLIIGDTASQWCQYDFDHVTVPVFFAVITGGSHISTPAQTLGALIGWYRWRLAGDTNIKRMFVGDDCELCNRRGWIVQQRDLE